MREELEPSFYFSHHGLECWVREIACAIISIDN